MVAVDGVTAAQSALEEQANRIECVIADHRLPDGYGVAFCVQCRVRYPHLLLGVVSGCLAQSDIDLMEEYAVPFWRKPVLYAQVADELEKSDLARLERMQNAPIVTPRKTPEKSTVHRVIRKFFR